LSNQRLLCHADQIEWEDVFVHPDSSRAELDVKSSDGCGEEAARAACVGLSFNIKYFDLRALFLFVCYHYFRFAFLFIYLFVFSLAICFLFFVKSKLLLC